MLGDQRRQRRLRASEIVARLERIDGRGVHDLAGGVDGGDLDAGAHAGIEPQRRPRAGRSGQQQIFKVVGEHLDRLFFRALAQLRHQVQRQRGGELDAPSPAGDLAQIDVAGRVACRQIAFRDHALGRLSVDLQLQRQEAFVAAAQHGERAMARGLGPGLGMVEIVGEFRARVLFAVFDLGRAGSRAPACRRASAPTRSALTAKLSDRMSRAPSSAALTSATSPVDIRRGEFAGAARRFARIASAKRPQAALAGDVGLGAALGLVGKIEIFQLGLAGRASDCSLQRARQLALAANGVEDRGATRLQFAQIGEPLRQLTQLRVVEPAGRLLAIAGDEGHRRAFVQQLDCGAGLLRTGFDLGGDKGGDATVGLGHVLSKFDSEPRT